MFLGGEKASFLLGRQALRKTTGLFVSSLTLDPSTQLATVFAWLAVAAEATQSQLCGGAGELPAWQRCSSATQLSAAEYRTAKENNHIR